MGESSTLDQTDDGGLLLAGEPQPGLLLVFSVHTPMLAALSASTAPIAIGRSAVGWQEIDDARVSRRHAEVIYAGDRWLVRDLDSRNGTSVDGVRVAATLDCDQPRVLRAGDTVLLFCPDVRPFVGARVECAGETVIGPTLLPLRQEIQRLAATSETLHLKGATGTGKEIAARWFHQPGAESRGPFVGVNCAEIVPQLAERLLFGARKGSYSGADADVEGHFQAAHGGTLFLDEVAELGLDVQAKLLRAIESREVMALGGSRPRKVEVRLCSATHEDLRAAVAAGKFREDLYFRISRPTLVLPELRSRPEDIPWLIVRTLARAKPPLEAHASLVEAALGRIWPGNVRELVLEVVNAADRARAEGDEQVRVRHLAREAGLAMAQAPPTLDEPDEESRERERLEAVLRGQNGNVASAARVLGIHRNQLRRLIERYQVRGARTRDARFK